MSSPESKETCTRCQERPRRPKQRWCRECHAEYVRISRQAYVEQMATEMMSLATRDDGPLSGVYFVACEGYVKIGLSSNVVQRFRTIQVANPFKVEPLGFIAKSSPLEAEKLEVQLHERFKPERIHGEWFRYSQDLGDFISEHAAPWPVSDRYWMLHVEQAKDARQA